MNEAVYLSAYYFGRGVHICAPFPRCRSRVRRLRKLVRLMEAMTREAAEALQIPPGPPLVRTSDAWATFDASPALMPPGTKYAVL